MSINGWIKKIKNLHNIEYYSIIINTADQHLLFICQKEPEVTRFSHVDLEIGCSWFSCSNFEPRWLMQESVQPPANECDPQRLLAKPGSTHPPLPSCGLDNTDFSPDISCLYLQSPFPSHLQGHGGVVLAMAPRGPKTLTCAWFALRDSPDLY